MCCVNICVEILYAFVSNYVKLLREQIGGNKKMDSATFVAWYYFSGWAGEEPLAPCFFAVPPKKKGIVPTRFRRPKTIIGVLNQGFPMNSNIQPRGVITFVHLGFSLTMDALFPLFSNPTLHSNLLYPLHKSIFPQDQHVGWLAILQAPQTEIEHR